MHAKELSLLSLTDSAADGDGSVLVISGDHDDSNAGLDAVLDGGCDFGPGWVQHADHPDKSDAAFVIEEFGGVFEIHVGFGHGIVDATEGQTTESVAAGAPRVRHFQDTGLDRRRHRHLLIQKWLVLIVCLIMREYIYTIRREGQLNIKNNSELI